MSQNLRWSGLTCWVVSKTSVLIMTKRRQTMQIIHRNDKDTELLKRYKIPSSFWKPFFYFMLYMRCFLIATEKRVMLLFLSCTIYSYPHRYLTWFTITRKCKKKGFAVLFTFLAFLERNTTFWKVINFYFNVCSPIRHNWSEQMTHPW